MTQHGLYVIKDEFFKMVQALGGDCDVKHGSKRPVYYCLKDSKIDGLYWMIPTSDLDHRNQTQLDKYNKYISLPDDDLRSCFYHIAKTTKMALYKVSSCFPVTDEYIDHEYTTSGVHVVVRRSETINELERKLKRILAVESRNPNYFPQHITDIKNKLLHQ